MRSYRIKLEFQLPKQLIVNNTPFSYPTSKDEPGWGADATLWACEVTKVLSNILGPNDILETSFNIVNNQTTVANVTGLIFDSGSVRSAEVDYAIYRRSDLNLSGNAETGKMHLIYDNNAGWSISIGDVVGLAGVNFTITATGQVQYTSTDIDSLNYIGTIKFKATALQQ